MTALVLILAIIVGAFVVALALNIAADWREAERSRRQREALRRAAQRECGDAR